MTIIVEDGTIVTGANSYVSEAEFQAYADARGETISGNLEQLLIKSMDYIESLEYIGWKAYSTQPMQWPRGGVRIDGYLIIPSTIPKELKNGQIETALSIDRGQDPMQDVDVPKQHVRVGDLEVTYSGNRSTVLVQKISNALRKLLKGGAGGSFDVSRG